MTLPQAWMQQAESDYRTAQRVDNDADPRTRCQAISKYQQCVEKYPFQETAAEWRAPSEVDVFRTGEMRRIRNCAGSLIVGLRQILDALDLLFP